MKPATIQGKRRSVTSDTGTRLSARPSRRRSASPTCRRTGTASGREPTRPAGTYERLVQRDAPLGAREPLTRTAEATRSRYYTGMRITAAHSAAGLRADARRPRWRGHSGSRHRRPSAATIARAAAIARSAAAAAGFAAVHAGAGCRVSSLVPPAAWRRLMSRSPIRRQTRCSTSDPHAQNGGRVGHPAGQDADAGGVREPDDDAGPGA